MNTPTVQSEPGHVSTVPVADNGGARQATQGRAFSPGELAFLIGVPLLWAVLLLFHPGGEGTEVTYAELPR